MRKLKNEGRKLKRGSGEIRYITLQTALAPEYGERVKQFAKDNDFSVSSLIEFALKQVVK